MRGGEVIWVDERESEFPPGPLPAQVRQVCVEAANSQFLAGFAQDCRKRDGQLAIEFLPQVAIYRVV